MRLSEAIKRGVENTEKCKGFYFITEEMHKEEWSVQ
jgi:hypothetical protein